MATVAKDQVVLSLLAHVGTEEMSHDEAYGLLKGLRLAGYDVVKVEAFVPGSYEEHLQAAQTAADNMAAALAQGKLKRAERYASIGRASAVMAALMTRAVSEGDEAGPSATWELLREVRDRLELLHAKDAVETVEELMNELPDEVLHSRGQS